MVSDLFFHNDVPQKEDYVHEAKLFAGNCSVVLCALQARTPAGIARQRAIFSPTGSGRLSGVDPQRNLGLRR
jgi:hypothetical protein